MIRSGAVVRVHNGPFFISSNAELVYHDLIASGKQVETTKRWRALIPCVGQILALCVSSI
jgi:hypothetical protein